MYNNFSKKLVGDSPPQGGASVQPIKANGRKVTMADVARAADVSVSTVSLALSGRAGTGISGPTIERIHQAAKTLGYVPPKSASPNHLSQKRLIVLMEGLLVNPIGHLMLGGISQAAIQNEHRAVFMLEDLTDPSIEMLKEIEAQEPSGIVIATSYTREIDMPSTKIAPPVVLLNCWSGAVEYPLVLPNDKLGAIRATQHLLEAGAETVACISGESWISGFKDRIEGWRQAHIDLQMEADPELLLTGPPDFKSGFYHAKTLLARPKPPRAIFCSSDWLALGALQAITEAGLRVPADISLVGYDDQRFAAEVVPPMTTVRLPYDDMGEMAANIALQSPDLIRSGRLLVDSKLVQRGTVRKRNLDSTGVGPFE